MINGRWGRAIQTELFKKNSYGKKLTKCPSTGGEKTKKQAVPS